MKKLGIVLLVALAMLSLAACNKKKGNGFTETEATKFHVCGGTVELGSYDLLTKPSKAAQVTDEEVEESFQSELKNMLAEFPNYVRDESRDGTEVQTGDIINIDFVGKLDGEAFSGGSAKAYDLEIGSKTFIEDLENGLIGKTVGETVDIEATFPEDYNNEQLKGKTTVFTVTINYVGQLKEEADDAYVKRIAENMYGSDIESMDAMRQAIRESLQASKDESFEDDMFNDVLDQMVKNSNFVTILDEDVEYYAHDMIKYYTSLASYYGMSLEDVAATLFGSYDDMMNTVEEDAKEYVKQYMVLQEIVKKENITISDEKYKEMIADYMKTAQYSDQTEFENAYTKSYLLYCMKNDLALELLVEKAKVTD